MLPWNHDGTVVRLSGFVLPVDSEGDLVYEFLLVPVAEACSHMAATPANQIVHVFPKKPFRHRKLNGHDAVVARSHHGGSRPSDLRPQVHCV